MCIPLTEWFLIHTLHNPYNLGPGLASLSASLWRIHFGISEPIMISAETMWKLYWNFRDYIVKNLAANVVWILTCHLSHSLSNNIWIIYSVNIYWKKNRSSKSSLRAIEFCFIHLLLNIKSLFGKSMGRKTNWSHI